MPIQETRSAAGRGESAAASARRTRKSPQERRREITDAAVRLISERGYNGISVQDVADMVGVTKQGVLRHVGSKDNLLAMVYRDNYNRAGTIEDFLASGLPGSTPEDLRFPAYLRFLVSCNAKRRMLVQLFAVLQVESLNPDHPLHDEFAGRSESIWTYYSGFDWNIPPEMGEWRESMRPVVRRAMEVMDGVQLHWLRDASLDLNEEWSDLEPLLFPSPLWSAHK